MPARVNRRAGGRRPRAEHGAPGRDAARALHYHEEPGGQGVRGGAPPTPFASLAPAASPPRSPPPYPPPHEPRLSHSSPRALTLTHAPCLSQWARKKKIAAGVDPDEDFAAGREAESKIYVVGGAPAAATLAACPRTLLPAPPALSRPRPLARCPPLIAALRSELCAASFLPLAGLITVLVPTIAGIWAYNEGYLTPQ